MAIPSHLAKKLRQGLGDETGGDLVTWLDEMRAEHERARSETNAKFDAVISSIQALDARLSQKMDDRFARVDERLAVLQVAIADSKAELMKWMLVFWVGAVGAIAALAGVFRQ
jgi:hypothetical protein